MKGKLTPSSLKKSRKDLGISQMALGVKCNVSRYNISLFEGGYRDLEHDEETRIIGYIEKERKRGTTN